MKDQGRIIPDDDDPDYVWIDMTPEECEANIRERKARLIRHLGLTAEEAEEDDEFLTLSAAQRNCGTAVTPPDWQEILLAGQGAAGLRHWSQQQAMLGKKRVHRAALDLN